MIKVLLVCHGNICRSPIAEYVFKDMVNKAGFDDSFEISSAATSREEIGNDIYPPAKRVMSAHGIPFEHHSARQMTRDDLDHFDYIIAMEKYNLSNISRLFGNAGHKKLSLLMDYSDRPGDVSDPWYSGDFETAFKDIECGCKGLLETLTSNI